MTIKNPYLLPDRREAFEKALKLLREGQDRWTVSKQLDPALPRNLRQNIAAKAARLLYWENRRNEKK